MYSIIRKQVLNETTTLMEIEAPMVAAKAKPGQFIIFRIDEEGERVPLTIAGYDREKGTVTIIFQIVGYTTEKLNSLNDFHVVDVECANRVSAVIGLFKHFGCSNKWHGQDLLQQSIDIIAHALWKEKIYQGGQDEKQLAG